MQIDANFQNGCSEGITQWLSEMFFFFFFLAKGTIRM